MKQMITILLFLFSGCAQLMNGQSQPVISSSKFKGAYFTTCGGAVEDWGTCNLKAQQACPKGYTILEKNADSTGVKREIHFDCNK